MPETLAPQKKLKTPDKTSHKRVAVIIPAFNVAAHIEAVIRCIPEFVDKIIVVDDDSRDKTRHIVSEIQDPRVVLMVHLINRGVGAAMKTGYRKAIDLGMDILVKMDGDGQMKSEHLSGLIRPLQDGTAHYAKGNRFADYRTLERMPALRRFGNAWLSFFTKFVSGYWNVYDVTNGYTAILSSAYRRIDPRKIADGYFFETSMLIELNITRARVYDVDMPSVYGDENSHLMIRRVATKFPLLLLRGIMRRYYQRHFIRDFGILSLCLIAGGPLFLFGTAYGFRLWFAPPNPNLPTPAGMVMLAALPIIMGFQLILASLILDVIGTPNKGPAEDSR